MIEAQRLLVTGDLTLRAIKKPVAFAHFLNEAGRRLRIDSVYKRQWLNFSAQSVDSGRTAV